MARFAFEVIEDLYRHVREESAHRVGQEVGGLLFGAGAGADLTVTRAVPTVNSAANPWREWTSDPAEISPTLKTYEAQGLELLGSFHTHPFGNTLLSRADYQLMCGAPPLLLLVAAPLDEDRSRWDWKVHHSGRADGPLDLLILPPQHIRL